MRSPRSTGFAVAVLLGVAIGPLAGVANAAASSWSTTRVLVPASVMTFSPNLAVNGRGAAVATWFAGPAPQTRAASDRTRSSVAWRGNKVVVALGSTTAGFRRPVVVAEDGSDRQGDVTAAISSSGIGYVAWKRATGPGVLIVTARHGQLSRPRVLALAPHALFQRLANDRRGRVDALWSRATGHGFAHFCTRLTASGADLGTAIAARAGSTGPCGARTLSNAPVPQPLSQPDGFQLASYSLVSRHDDHSNAIAVWDDWPTTGPAWTYGLFYVTHRA